MNIAVLGHKRVPSREGGVEVVVEELSVRMAAQGHRVTCYNRSGHHVSGKEFDTLPLKEFKGVQLKTVPAINLKGLAAMTASLFASIRAAFGRYDVVHFHTEGPCATLWLPKLFGRRCIATVHGLDHQRSKWGRLARTYILLGEKVAAKYADEIIVLSRNVQEYFLKNYNRQTRYIPNGVTPVEPRPAELIHQQFGLTKDSYILFLGRMTPEKGVHFLLEAYKGLRTDKKLVIAGGASDSQAYFDELKAAAAGSENIVFTGFVQGQMLEELYSNACLYVLPSTLEGMPLTLLEAMSYGNCCVVSDIPECTEIVEDKAMVFPTGDVGQLRESLQKALDDPDMVAQYRDAAAALISSKYSWDDVVAKTMELYKRKG
ncbi:MAG: glycosyltransferase family 4 protein [Clostridia bacterium]|nr:glycosyltransferase family 4 protein [Clostridia bacterium]